MVLWWLLQLQLSCLQGVNSSAHLTSMVIKNLWKLIKLKLQHNVLKFVPWPLSCALNKLKGHTSWSFLTMFMMLASWSSVNNAHHFTEPRYNHTRLYNFAIKAENLDHQNLDNFQKYLPILCSHLFTVMAIVLWYPTWSISAFRFVNQLLAANQKKPCSQSRSGGGAHYVRNISILRLFEFSKVKKKTVSGANWQPVLLQKDV